MHTIHPTTALSQRINLFVKILLGAFVVVLIIGVIIGHPAITSHIQTSAATPIAFVSLIGIVLYVRTKMVDCMFDGLL